MRLYGGRIIKRKADQRSLENRELFDALVWDVNTNVGSHYCRVKIQGSDELIRAYYNENWKLTPEWLKAGNAVRVSLPAGNRGRVEVAGHGFTLPTAVAGGSVTAPVPTPPNAVLTGMVLSAAGDLSYSPSLFVSVATGTYRIAGVHYVLGAMTMNDTVKMNRVDVVMGSMAVNVPLDYLAPNYFRIDVIEIGADGVVDVNKGTAALSDPVKPTTSTGHALIGWVLLTPTSAGATGVIYSTNINTTWGPSVVTRIAVTDANDWSLPYQTETTTFTIQLLDQYGVIVTSTYSLTLTYEDSYGTGTFTYNGVSDDTTLTVLFTGDVDIEYTRNPTPESNAAISPMIRFSETISGLIDIKFLELYGVGDVLLLSQ